MNAASTAALTADYTISASPLAIAPGSTTVALTITVATDTLDEDDESVIVNMGAPSNASLGTTANHTATITDDDAIPSVVFTAATQTSTDETGLLTITAQLSAASSKNITVPFSVNGASTASDPGDYSVSASPLNIAAGATTANITITLAGDAIDEDDETVIIDMGAPTNASIGATSNHTATITDDDAQPTVSFTSGAAASGTESGVVNIIAQLSAASGKTVSIPFSVNGSSTAGGGDYGITGSPVTIAPGSTTVAIAVTISADTTDEPDETVIVNMGSATNATSAGTIVHTTTINDDDAAPTVQFTVASQASGSETGTMSITAQLAAVSEKNVSIPFSVNAASTAADPADYSISASPLAIAAGATTAVITITIATDAAPEANETVVINMGAATNATAAGTTNHTATITDDDIPTVQFTAASQSAAEGVGSMTIVAQLSATTTSTVSVPFTVNAASTAANPADYTVTGSPVLINPGSTTVNIVIAINDDVAAEANETVVVNMGVPVNANAGATVNHTATIVDNELPTVQFTSASQNSTGESGSMTIVAQISAPSASAVTVPFTIDGGSTALNPADYSITASPLNIAPGSTTANVVITINGDALDETNETIVVNMGVATNANATGTTVHTATITDDDAQPSVTFTSASQSSTGESGTMTISAQLSAASGLAISIPFSINGSSTAADPADYSISTSPANITAGSTTAQVVITIAGDTLDEDNETIVVNMGAPTNASTGATTNHTATITDDDAAPTVQFTAATQASGVESGTLTVVAQLSAASGKAITVPFSVNASSTAVNPADYTLSASPLNISAGATTAAVTITLATDTLDEDNETVIIDMGGPTNATASGTTNHTATITDDDAAPTVQFTAAGQSSGAESGSMTITAQLSAASSKVVSLPFSVNASSTALNPDDYTITSSPLAIAAGSTTANVIITIATDAIDENNETVVVELGSATNATTSGTTSHTATITDDDAEPTVQFTAAAQASVGESGTLAIVAQLSAASGKGVTVPFSVNGSSTASLGSDYSLSASPLSIAAGSTTAAITLTISTDTLDEDNETSVIDMGVSTNATSSGTTTHTATITDDDAAPTVQFTAAAQTSGAESGSMTIVAQLSAASSKIVSVPFSVNASSTAANPADYTLTTSPVAIAAGTTTAHVIITIATDTLDEPNETVVVGMGAPTNASAVGTINHTATITDDDAVPTVTFTSSAASSTNESGTMTITAQLSAASSQAVTIPYSVNGSSTAIDPADYSIAASPAVINALSTTTEIVITIATDTLDENDETVVVNMGAPTNATTGAITNHTMTIMDDDAAPTVQFTAASQSSGGETGTLTITAQISSVSAKAISVPFSINGGSTAANPADYSISASPLSISAGATTAAITLTIATDALDEDDETVIVNMGSATNATASGTTTHTATITDDDPTPTVQFTAASQTSVAESGTLTITVQLSAVSSKAVSVPFSINGASTAVNPADYSISSSPLAIAAGATTATATITIGTDTIDEPNEVVIIDMGSPTNATASGTTSHTATINDDDSAPTISFTAATQVVNETAAGTITVKALLSAASGQTVSVPFSVNGSSTALNPADYTISGSPLAILAGATSVNIAIPVNNDSLAELSETIIVDMGAVVNATPTGTINHTVTISHSDIAIVGRVTDNVSGANVAGATVSTQDSNLNTVNATTDAGGISPLLATFSIWAAGTLFPFRRPAILPTMG